MRVLLLSLFPLVASAQTLTPSAPVSVQRGSSFTLNITAGAGTATGPVATQWTLTVPAGWTVTSPTTALANKVIACAVGNLKCLVYGINAAVIANGTVATLTVTVPPLATLGNATITTSGTLGATNTGGLLTTAGGSATINVLPDARDLNGDGVIDQADAISAVTQIFGTCTNADIAPPPGCDVVDLVIIVLKAQGLIQ